MKESLDLSEPELILADECARDLKGKRSLPYMNGCICEGCAYIGQGQIISGKDVKTN